MARAPSWCPLQSRDHILALQTTRGLRHMPAALSPSSYKSPSAGDCQAWHSLGLHQVISPGFLLLWGVGRTSRLSPALLFWVQARGCTQNHECTAPPACQPSSFFPEEAVGAGRLGGSTVLGWNRLERVGRRSESAHVCVHMRGRVEQWLGKGTSDGPPGF